MSVRKKVMRSSNGIRGEHIILLYTYLYDAQIRAAAWKRSIHHRTADRHRTHRRLMVHILLLLYEDRRRPVHRSFTMPNVRPMAREDDDLGNNNNDDGIIL